MLLANNNCIDSDVGIKVATVCKLLTISVYQQIQMPTFRVLVFQNVSLVGRFEVYIPVDQQNNKTMETSYFTVATFLI